MKKRGEIEETEAEEGGRETEGRNWEGEKRREREIGNENDIKIFALRMIGKQLPCHISMHKHDYENTQTHIFEKTCNSEPLLLL